VIQGEREERERMACAATRTKRVGCRGLDGEQGDNSANDRWFDRMIKRMRGAERIADGGRHDSRS
jgi:hypothetical protein